MDWGFRTKSSLKPSGMSKIWTESWQESCVLFSSDVMHRLWRFSNPSRTTNRLIFSLLLLLGTVSVSFVLLWFPEAPASFTFCHCPLKKPFVMLWGSKYTVSHVGCDTHSCGQMWLNLLQRSHRAGTSQGERGLRGKAKSEERKGKWIKHSV